MNAEPDAPLTRLEQILEDEAEALRTIDVRGIDRAAHAKEALEPALARLLGAPLSDDDRTRLSKVRDRARQNQVRLAATLSSVRGLLRALVTDVPPSYGPRSEPSVSRPVLTSVVG
jgi:hypothetical protein